MSLNSAPLSQSSKYNDPGYFDSLPPRKRTMSESAGSGDSVRTIDFPPNIPARSSSLSAPTSRNTSRAGSLTAESLRAHNTIQAQNKEAAKEVKPEPVQSHPSPEEEVETDNVPPLNVDHNFDHNGDPFFGKRLSTQVTPFSQVSYETAGTTAEVSEALAVSIFPHQNKSVLVVQQRASSDPSPPNLKAIDTTQQPKANGPASMGPVTPPQAMFEIDCRLWNPRAPPEPPAIKFIPPTPAALTPGADEVPFSDFGGSDGSGGGRSYSQIDKPVSETTLSPRMKDFNSKGGAIGTAVVNSHQSPASEGTVAGSIHPPESEGDIQDLSRPKAFDSCGASGTMSSLVENTKSKGGTHSANGFRESTITTTAELRSETETELLKNNGGFGPSEPPSNFACDSPVSKGESIPEDVKEATKIIAVTADVTSDSVDRPKAVGVHGILTKPYKVLDIEHLIIENFHTRGCHQRETVDKDMSSSTSSDFHIGESEQTGSDNTTDELCSHLKHVRVDGEVIMTPILNPARRAMVDRVMAQFWAIFEQQWSSNVRQHFGTSYQESETVGSTPPKQRTAESRSFQRKRQRKGEEEDSDRGDDRTRQPPSQSTPPANGPTERPKFACMFRKHDPCRYSIYSHRSCALSHWPSIARVKYCTHSRRSLSY
jgi:hypothetical protein